MRRIAVFCAAVVLLLPFAAAAQSRKPEEVSCTGVVSAGEESKLQLMKVVGAAQRVHFIENLSTAKPFCPADIEACRRRGFVVPGDTVIAGPTINGLVCVSYVAPNVKRAKGRYPESSGFLPESALQVQPSASPRMEEWLGDWSRSSEAEIKIKMGRTGQFNIDGNAFWGALDPGRVERGGVNTGEFGYNGMPKGNMIAVGEGYDGTKPFGDDRSECRVKLQLFGRYLVVEDNMACGGMNVSFTGIYVRLK